MAGICPINPPGWLSLPPSHHSSIRPSTHPSVAPSLRPSHHPCLIPSSLYSPIYPFLQPYISLLSLPSLHPSHHPSIPLFLPPSHHPSIPLFTPPSILPSPTPRTTSRRHRLSPERSPCKLRGVCSHGRKEQGGCGCFFTPNSANDGADLAAPECPEVVLGVKSCVSHSKLQNEVSFCLGTCARHQALSSPFLCPWSCRWRSCAEGEREQKN